MNSKKNAHLLAVLLMIIWGLSYMSIDIAIVEVSPPLVAFYRFALASVIMYTILKIKYPEEKVVKEDKGRMALGGLFGVSIYFFLQNYSVALTSPANVAILLAAVPIFMALVQRILFKEKMTWNKNIGIALSVIGIAIIVSSKEHVSLFSTGTRGDLLALGASFSWVIYNIINANFKGEYKLLTITTYQGIWGSVFLSPSLLMSEISPLSFKVIANIVYLALACSIAGYCIYIYCLKELGATVVTTYINLQPIVSLSASYFILKETITMYQIIGCIVIISGLFLVNANFKSEKNQCEEVCIDNVTE